MRCADANECFEQIRAYFSGKKTGHFLIVNTENYDIYQEILQRLQADNSKKCIYVSTCCLPVGLPDVDAAVSKTVGVGQYALVGFSQALMFRGHMELEEAIDELLGRPISGHGIVLLDHCEQTLNVFLKRDIRVNERVLLVDGEVSELPQIKMAKSAAECIGYQPLPNFSSLLAYLEKMTEEKLRRHPSLTVIANYSISVFHDCIYPIAAMEKTYFVLARKYSDIAGATEESYGSDSQWTFLANEMKNHASFSSLVCNYFGTTTNLSAHLADVIGADDSRKQWLIWLAMKVFGEPSNGYLTIVLNNSKTYDKFIEHAYLDFTDIDVSDRQFTKYFNERKRLLEQLPENLPLASKYCERIGKHQKDGIFYLTDCSEAERYEFVRLLSIYDYSEKEIMRAVRAMSKSIAAYLKEFTFDSTNTKLPDTDFSFRDELTDYFKAYKLQKLSNRIFPEFLDKVNQYAQTRPYYKLQPRASVISHMDRNNTQLFFFDALGVEYLSFITAKCEEYGMVSEVSVAHCELPSITSENKEFLKYYQSGEWFKIDALDEIKHHSQVYDYTKCEYPIHLFEELEVIDKELRKIHSKLIQGSLEKAVIVSDHGASRLAVIYGHEVAASISLDESGGHSGRCCPAEEDPQIPFAAYEGGFSVLANYERFKGGRRANVEVHGGASLEEVLVPVILLTKRPENIELCFVDPVIELKPRVVPELTLYSNIPLEAPRLCIAGEFYKGEFVADKKHAKFILPKIKRKGDYSAEVFDGNKNLSVTLKFAVQKQTHEVELF